MTLSGKLDFLFDFLRLRLFGGGVKRKSKNRQRHPVCVCESRRKARLLYDEHVRDNANEQLAAYEYLSFIRYRALPHLGRGWILEERVDSKGVKSVNYISPTGEPLASERELSIYLWHRNVVLGDFFNFRRGLFEPVREYNLNGGPPPNTSTPVKPAARRRNFTSPSSGGGASENFQTAYADDTLIVAGEPAVGRATPKRLRPLRRFSATTVLFETANSVFVDTPTSTSHFFYSVMPDEEPGGVARRRATLFEPPKRPKNRVYEDRRTKDTPAGRDGGDETTSGPGGRVRNLFKYLLSCLVSVGWYWIAGEANMRTSFVH